MSYMTQAAIAESLVMQQRVTTCAAQQGAPGDPQMWASTTRWRWATAPGWDAAWESALATDPGADPAVNEGAITDGMILSEVQRILAVV